MSPGWEFWIDRGGTFTDCIARSPDGSLRTAKLLSSDTAPVEAVRRILEQEGEVPAGGALPPCKVKLGSTVATNALLERRGAPTALVTHATLTDVFTVGTQERPELFELAIDRPLPVHTHVAPVVGRVAVDGTAIEALDRDAVRAALAAARDAGATSAAVVLMHAYAWPEMEREILEIAREVGLPDAVASHQVARELGFLARGETTTADAYLTPLLARHVRALTEALPGSQLRFMQSSGGLTDAARFRGPGALLSGPAGGVVAAARVARRAGFERAVGFDMGGTSTDVSLIVGGEVDRAFETLVGGIRVKSPMLKIHTVAAGGGSLCRFDGFRLTVGPESAGADPGPLCYGRASPGSRELALTDVNLFLGRLQPDRFPLALDASPVVEALEQVRTELRTAGFPRSLDEVAAGFVEVANASMAEAIQQVSVGRGVDPRDCALVGFGGAGGQHVCAIARALSIGTVLLHPFAGLLSAYGIGVAELSWDGQRDAARVDLPAAGDPLPAALGDVLRELEAAGREALAAEGVAPEAVRIEHWLDLRYRGTDTPLPVRDDGGADAASAFDWAAAFAAEHARRFGYVRPDRAIEITTVRVRARGPAAGAPEPARRDTPGERPALPEPLRRVEAWFPAVGRARAPVYARDSLAPGAALSGPAILLEDTGTVVVDPGFGAVVHPDGVLVLTDEARGSRPTLAEPERSADVADPVRLEVFGNRFMSIAEQMGAVLRNTSVSTNIKERLDYSCAVFDGSGGLVANAPHIPVHLGAMSETVRAAVEAFPDVRNGDVFVTNDPFAGGSHLPDVTVVTPIFLTGSTAPDFFVASRGHHADIGGATPGSMPPDSATLEEEGVVIPLMRLVRDGVLDEAAIRARLENARYPARQPADNLADLEAMVAANRAGERLLQGFASDEGPVLVARTMAQLQAASAEKVAHEIGRLPEGVHRFEDRLDDGTPVRVAIEIRGRAMTIDFAGTGPAVPGNLNAPRAIVQAAVIYVLRSLVAERIPLNGGCLDPVEVRVPPGSLLDPPPGRAVVGGNVETSQRVVDVLLGALELAAASQGTMNNVTFGDRSFGYYETIGGGSGAGPDWDGTSGVHTHMTNTRITDPEVLEARYPVRLAEFSLRRGSGGRGAHRGGDGLVRRYAFQAPVTATLLTERRTTRPYGLRGGEPGRSGRNAVERADGEIDELPGKCSIELAPGDVLTVETPGGGGWGTPT